MKANKVVWCETGFFPVWYGFCPSELAFFKECKQLKVDMSDFRYLPPANGARVSYLEKDDGSIYCVVYLGKNVDVNNTKYVFSLLVHEAVHIWQEIKSVIGEKQPSPEFEAYSIQYIYSNLVDAFLKTIIE